MESKKPSYDELKTDNKKMELALSFIHKICEDTPAYNRKKGREELVKDYLYCDEAIEKVIEKCEAVLCCWPG